jgi:hypothetical protein
MSKKDDPSGRLKFDIDHPALQAFVDAGSSLCSFEPSFLSSSTTFSQTVFFPPAELPQLPTTQ